MRGFLKEFREFMDRGNVMDMAVGIIVGGAFTAIVQALIKDIINPIITAITGGTGDSTGWSIPIPGSTQAIDFGAFISAIINFVLIALIVFILMRWYNGAKEIADKAKRMADRAMGVEPVDPGETPVPRTCPYCGGTVSDEATRCPHCTSVLPNASAADVRAMRGAAEE